MKGYEKRSKSIIQLIDKIRDEGAALDIDLPTVVFCGNQSAGKSSLIESISGIMLPRSDGTCTRCPMELRLSEGNNEEWKCSISLQFQVDSSGHQLAKPKEVEFYNGITNIEDVEIMVRRAQKAILNPNKNPSIYQDYTFDDSSLESRMKDIKSNELTFTVNTVCIKIIGSNVNLTLIDLPGIIRTTENTSESRSIGLVEGMVQSYIKNPRALIIATISCKDEIENQAILSLAKAADPQGERTIGVLTKPDTIEAGCHDTWFQVLNNRRYRLKLGYYIIKNPTKQELDEKVSFKEARERERIFFRANSPWNTASASAKEHMGVDRLSEALSIRLTELIEVSLPSMREKVNELLDTAQKELAAFPPPLSQNPKLELITCVRNYNNSLKEILEARGAKKEIYQKIEGYFHNFNSTIASNHPRLIIPNPDPQTNPKSSIPHILYDNENDLEFGFTAKQITEIIDRQKGRELPLFIKGEALNELVRACQKNWRETALHCLSEVEEELKIFILGHVRPNFGRFYLLSALIESKLDDLLNNLVNATKNLILYACDMEMDCPATWDMSHLEEILGKYHESLEAPLNNKCLGEFNKTPDKDINQVIAQLALIGINTTKNMLPSLLPGLYDTKVRKVFESSAAYYRLAQLRFGDLVPMIIYRSLVQKFSSSIECHLIRELGILDDDSSQVLKMLIEDPNIASKRIECNERLNRLREVRKSIFS